MPKCPRWRWRTLTFSDWMTSSAGRGSEIPSLSEDTKSSMPFFFSCKSHPSVKSTDESINSLEIDMWKVWDSHSAGWCARVLQGYPAPPQHLPETSEEDWRSASSRPQPGTEREREYDENQIFLIPCITVSSSLHTHLIWCHVTFFISSVYFSAFTLRFYVDESHHWISKTFKNQNSAWNAWSVSCLNRFHLWTK